MYKAELYFRVFTRDGHVTLFKELTLPFVPFPGPHVYTSAKDVEGGKVSPTAAWGSYLTCSDAALRRHRPGSHSRNRASHSGHTVVFERTALSCSSSPPR
jgi:hypothetical protein